MKTYKYTNTSNTVVHIIDDDGISRSSCLASTLPEGSVVEPYAQTSADLNAPIFEQLGALDLKLIRPLSEGDHTRIAEILAEKATLRGLLVK